MTVRVLGWLSLALFTCLTGGWSFAAELQAKSPIAMVEALLDAPPAAMDFAGAKLAVDKFVDPSVDEAAALAEIDDMAATVRKMLATLPPAATVTDIEKLKALRAFLYEAGWWNDNRPFQYDLSDPLGQKPGSQLLTTYLATRKGNCVSMPTLLLALGERLGLEMTLSTAPLHLFVKWTDGGKTWNLEATSGGGFTRDEHYRKQLPMTDEAVRNGVYLKRLTRREALSVMATALVDRLIAAERFDEAVSVADVLVEAYPANAYALVKKGTAYYRLLERDIIKKYPKQSDIPAERRAYANGLYRQNQDAFAKAEALGWRVPE
jgi:regulator of sirC expression with transglutaminase-like and TPR domain